MPGPLVNAVLKGVLEGLTEFLPISSTGHLMLVDELLPLTTDLNHQKNLNEVFNIVIQLPAIFAIIVLYRQRIFSSLTALPARAEARRFWMGLCIAFLPVGLFGYYMSKNYNEQLKALEKPVPIAWALVIGGIFLILVDRIRVSLPIERAEEVPLTAALNIGLFQCLALWPGTSRSGATIVGGRIMGLSRSTATEYTFFLALPTMFVACGYKFIKEYKNIDWTNDGLVLLVGSATSFCTAWLAVSLFIKFVQKHSLAWFGGYRILLGTGILLWFYSK